MSAGALMERIAIRAFAAALAICAAGCLACAEERRPPVEPGPWDVEPFKSGLVAVSRASDHRTAILIFCTLIGTKNVVYAYDGRGLDSEQIPISAVRVLATPTIEIFGQSLPSSAATFANDGSIFRMQVPLPRDYELPQSDRMTIGSGPDAAPEYRWSVAVGNVGLEDSLRIAFKNCV